MKIGRSAGVGKSAQNEASASSMIGRIMVFGAAICLCLCAAYTSSSKSLSELETAERAAANVISKSEKLKEVFALDEQTASVFAESDIYEGQNKREWSLWGYIEEVMRELLER